MIGMNTMMDSHESEFWLDPKILSGLLTCTNSCGILKG